MFELMAGRSPPPQAHQEQMAMQKLCARSESTAENDSTRCPGALRPEGVDHLAKAWRISGLHSTGAANARLPLKESAPRERKICARPVARGAGGANSSFVFRSGNIFAAE